MENKQKAPIAKETIFKIMLYITFGVAGAFFIKNLIGVQVVAMIVIGASLLFFSGTLLVMRRVGVAFEKRQFTVCMGLSFLIFFISIFSGESFSDDFLIHIAALGLAGLYLRPRQTAIQAILSFVLLIVQAFICPQKTGEVGQYILCLAMFALAVSLIYLVIARGRGFISMAHTRADEAEGLLGALQKIGEELQLNFENSTEGIKGLREASEHLNCNADELKQGSDSIAQGTKEVSDTCGEVQIKIQETEKQVEALTDGIRDFEELLGVNKENMYAMSQQMESVQTTMQQANEVFKLLEKYMQEISSVTDQLYGISSSTTMLALNASIEAARAGKSGAGFAVVASKVQELAVDSNRCSSRVASAVEHMQKQVQMTTTQLEESGQAIHTSLDTLQGLQSSFEQLMERFGALYRNIESQNNTIGQVDSIFGQLKNRIGEMNRYSEDNQNAVESISEAMGVYNSSMEQMIADTEHIHKLSADMLSMSNK
ncbi:MAG: methyl-accepting chemotaxis protein [Lachnospiraceae bacterium]|nr:methyl-accepting chemotaxis protein [Lachnospiraceae bacterium]